MTARSTLTAAALALTACIATPEPAVPTPSASASPTPTATPLVALAAASCAPLRPATFEGRLKELGYAGYLECSGSVRNAGTVRIDSLDVWVDQLDAAGSVIGSCRISVTDRGSLGPGRDAPWSATCPATTEWRMVRLRATDAQATPVATASPR